MSAIWIAPSETHSILKNVMQRHHSHLSASYGGCEIGVAFSDTKPFISNRFNWGSVKKFSDLNKLWMAPTIDFCVVLCADVWHHILDKNQQEAIIDLHLTRIEPEYVPELVVENGRKKVVKDEWGRIKYTNELKLGSDGLPKWKVHPLDLAAFTKNVRRYGLWCEELHELKSVVQTN